MPIKTRPPPLQKTLLTKNKNERSIISMVRKIFNKAISALTTTLLAFTTLASAIPITTYAADATVKSKHHVLKQSDTAATGYGTFDFNSNSSKYTFSVDSKSDKLTKTPKSGNKDKWIWQEQDENAGGITGLNDAYIAKLTEDSSFSVWYKNVPKVVKGNKVGNYDVKITYDNARGAISGANGKDIAIFDGQLGAVRFRGYKHIRCTIYVYKHGTTQLISGSDDKLHFKQHEVFSLRISKCHSLFFFLANRY